MIGEEIDITKPEVVMKKIDDIQKEIGKKQYQEDASVECNYEANSRNETSHNELVKYFQEFKCEECSCKANTREIVQAHKETLHKTVASYDCDEKTTSVEKNFEKSDQMNLEETIAVILMSIATLLAFSVGSLHKEQDVHEDDENQDPIEDYDCDPSN